MAEKKTNGKGTWEKGDVEVVKYVLDGKVVKAKQKKEQKPEQKPAKKSK